MEKSFLKIEVTINERCEDGIKVDMHTETHDLTSRELIHCLASAVNDMLNTTADDSSIPLSYLRVRFVECLTEKTIDEI